MFIVCYVKSPWCMGKSIISMGHFQSQTIIQSLSKVYQTYPEILRRLSIYKPCIKQCIVHIWTIYLYIYIYVYIFGLTARDWHRWTSLFSFTFRSPASIRIDTGSDHNPWFDPFLNGAILCGMIRYFFERCSDQSHMITDVQLKDLGHHLTGNLAIIR